MNFFWYFLCFYGLVWANDGNLFYLHENGVTVKCENAVDGDSGVIDGVNYTKRTVQEIKADNSLAETACTSGITGMSELFKDKVAFNGDISHWDTSLVTSMSNMFKNCTSFNQNIQNWNTSLVNNMDSIFDGALEFDIDLKGWNIESVAHVPLNFNTGSNLSSSHLPKWKSSRTLYESTSYYLSLNLSTCPRGAKIQDYDGSCIPCTGGLYCDDELTVQILASDDFLFAVDINGQSIKQWRKSDSLFIREFGQTDSQITAMALLDGFVLTGHMSGSLFLWNYYSANLTKSFLLYKKPITKLKVDDMDSNFFYAAFTDGYVGKWSICSGSLSSEFAAPKDYGRLVDFDKKGEYLIAIFESKYTMKWNATNGDVLLNTVLPKRWYGNHAPTTVAIAFDTYFIGYQCSEINEFNLETDLNIVDPFNNRTEWWQQLRARDVWCRRITAMEVQGNYLYVTVPDESGGNSRLLRYNFLTERPPNYLEYSERDLRMYPWSVTYGWITGAAEAGVRFKASHVRGNRAYLGLENATITTFEMDPSIATYPSNMRNYGYYYIDFSAGMAFHGDYVFFGEGDRDETSSNGNGGRVHMWNYRTDTYVKTFDDPADLRFVHDLSVSYPLLFFGGNRRNQPRSWITIFNIETGEFLNRSSEIIYHKDDYDEDPDNDLRFNIEKIVSDDRYIFASIHENVAQFNATTGRKIKQYFRNEKHRGAVENSEVPDADREADYSYIWALFISGDFLFVGGQSDRVLKYEIDSGDLKATYTGLGTDVWAILVWQNYLIAVGSSPNAVAWELTSGSTKSPAKTYRHGGSWLRNIAQKDGHIFVAGQDGIISEWDIESEERIRNFDMKSRHEYFQRNSVAVKDDVMFSCLQREVRKFNLSMDNQFSQLSPNLPSITCYNDSNIWNQQSFLSEDKFYYCPDNAICLDGQFYCLAGYERRNSSCVGCDPGFIKAWIGNQKCQKCAENLFCDDKISCAPGYEPANEICASCAFPELKTSPGNFSCSIAPQIISVTPAQNDWNQNTSSIDILIANTANDEEYSFFLESKSQAYSAFSNCSSTSHGSDSRIFSCKLASKFLDYSPKKIILEYQGVNYSSIHPEPNYYYPETPLVLSGGQILEILGHNLDSVDRILLDSTDCLSLNYSFYQSDKIQCTTPSINNSRSELILVRNGFINLEKFLVQFEYPRIRHAIWSKNGINSIIEIAGSGFSVDENTYRLIVDDGISQRRILPIYQNENLISLNSSWISSDYDYLIQLETEYSSSTYTIARAKNPELVNLTPSQVSTVSKDGIYLKAINLGAKQDSKPIFVHFKSNFLLDFQVKVRALQVNQTHLCFTTPDFPFPGVFQVELEISGLLGANSLEIEAGPMIVDSLSTKPFRALINDSTFYDYDYLHSISQLDNHTDDIQFLLIHGKNFGKCSINCSVSVLIGDYDCFDFFLVSDSLIVCKIPNETGTEYAVNVTVSNVSAIAPEFFNFSQPIIRNVVPNQYFWESNKVIKIIGSYFGNNIENINFLLIGNYSVQITEFNLTENELEFLLPDIDYSKTWKPELTVSAQKNQFLNLPKIFAVNPGIEVDAENSSQITIYGDQLDENCDVLIGDKFCSNIVKINDLAINCSVSPDVGAEKPIKVLKNGLFGESKAILSFERPIVSGVSPERYDETPDFFVFIIGKNFGITEPESVKVWFHDALNDTVYSAPNVSWVSSNLIKAQRNESMSKFNHWISVEISEQISREKNVTFLNNNDNLNPIVENTEANLDEGTSVEIELLGSDKDPQDSISYQITELPMSGKLFIFKDGQINGPVPNTFVSFGGLNTTVFYQHELGKGTSDSFMYRAVDSRDGYSNNATVSISIRKVNRPPQFRQTLIQLDVGKVEEVSVAIPIEDNDESDQIKLKAEKLPFRGIWTRTGSNKPLEFNNIVLKAGELLELNFKHDGMAGGEPFDHLRLIAIDSGGLMSSNSLTITLNVTCPAASPESPEKFNYIWADTRKCRLDCPGNSRNCKVCPICKECPDGGKCFRNGTNPTNQYGYYMLKNDLFLPCSPKSACPEGGSSNAKVGFQCAEGYTGPRCGDCEAGYYRVGNFCAKCATTELDVIVVVPLVVIGLAALIALMFLIRKFDLGFFGIMVTFVQTLAIFQNFKLEWPNSVLWLFNAFSIFNLNIDLASPECFLEDTSTRSYEVKYYTTLSMPIFLLLVVASIYGLILLVRKIKITYFPPEDSDSLNKSNVSDEPIAQKNSSYSNRFSIQKASEICSEDAVDKTILPVAGEMWSVPKEDISRARYSEDEIQPTITTSLLAACLFLFKVLYLTLARKSLELFNCVDDGKGSMYFDAVPSRKCFVEDWWFQLLPFSILGIVFYIVGIPVINLYLSVKRMKILKKQSFEFSERDKFILRITHKKRREFQNEYDYWDVVIMFRKFMIVVSQLFFASFPGFQAVFVVLVLFLAYLVQRNMMPYSAKSLNFLESSTIVSSTLVLMGGLLFFNGVLYNQRLDALGILVIILIVISTFAIIYMLGRHFNSLYRAHKSSKMSKASTEREAAQKDDFDEDVIVI